MLEIHLLFFGFFYTSITHAWAIKIQLMFTEKWRDETPINLDRLRTVAPASGCDTLHWCRMILAGIIGGWEIILILTIVFILLGARKLPEFGRGLSEGMKEFRKATREVAEEMEEALKRRRVSGKREEVSHPFLMVLTLILGTVCLILVLHEIFK